MLEQTRRQASIFVYLIFGLLIVIFVYGINPGSRGDAGCSTSSNTVVSVDGSDANNSAFLVAYSANQGQGRQRTYQALDEVIWREMLATAAADRGIRTTGDLIDNEIMTAKRGYFYLGGRRYDVTDQFFEDVDGEKLFSRKRWLAFVAARNLQSPNTYREEQARGLQASLMADLLTTSVRVSRDEALANYQYENNTVTYDVVAFDPARYRRTMHLTDADTKRFLDEHTAEVQARYKADERTYKAVKPELALREIFIPKALPAAPPSDVTPDAAADDKTGKSDKPDKSDDKAGKAGEKSAKKDDKTGKAGKSADKAGKAAGDAVKPFGLPVDAAKAKLEAVRAEIAAGKLAFADAEKQLAADSADDAPAENGDRGWRKADDPQLGETAVNTAAKALKPGEMTPVIATDRGVFLVIATGKREGDLGFDQVKSEIAAALAKETWSKEAAKRDALDALARAQTSGKTLDQLYEREVVRQPTNGLEQILQNPNLSDEQKRQILQQLMEQQKHGSLEVHEQDVPVAWYADDDGSSGSATAASAGGAAAPATGSAAPKAGTPGPAAGSAASASPAAGTAAPAAGSAAPGTEIVASKEILPQFGEVTKPKLNRFGPMPRQAKMAGVGTSKEAIATLFDELSPGQLAKRIYEGDNGYVVLQLINRAQPKIEDFDKTADAEIARMQDARGKAALHAWLKDRCETLNKAGRIRPAPDRIREVDDKGNPAPTVYRPCMYLDYLAQ